ncbi:MAG: class I SAM-dependent methyltransferase [Spirochaetes bacterium]|nr:class I SAM-dependent methyltransferase [Spirochaetota bacterium]
MQGPRDDDIPHAGIAETMKPYTGIAPVYDSLLRHVDYQEWYEYILSLMNRYAPGAETLLELGCGTGRFGSKFSNAGYTIYGIDRSMEMLRVARTRAFMNFRILCADITAFYTARKIDFIFSVHDTMNYLVKRSEVMRLLRCVRECMHDDSVFMFDITTEHNIYRNFDGKTSRHLIRSSTVEWSNSYDAKHKLVRSLLRIERGGVTEEEEHLQRIYAVDEMKSMLASGGFTLLGVFGDFSMDPPGEDTIMINFVARRA